MYILLNAIASTYSAKTWWKNLHYPVLEQLKMLLEIYELLGFNAIYSNQVSLEHEQNGECLIQLSHHNTFENSV